MDKTVQEEINYTTINHVARRKLGLSWLEYGLADLIYNLANNPASKVPGWCYSQKGSLSHTLGVGEATVYRCLSILLKAGLIEKNPEQSNLLRTTVRWYQQVVVKKVSVYQNDSPSIKERVSVYQNDSPESIKMIDYNNNDNDIDNTTSKDVAVKTAKAEESSAILKKGKPTNGEIREFGDPQINEVIKVFTDAYGHLPNIRNQRRYASMLIRKFSFDVALRGAKFAVDISGDEYAPKIGNPNQLWNKWTDMVLFGKKHTEFKPKLMKASDVAKFMRERTAHVVENP